METTSLRSLNLLTWILIVIHVPLIASCDFEDKRYKKVSESIDDLTSSMKEIAEDPSKTVDEVKKLRQVEYKLFPLDQTKSLLDMEAMLNNLGKENWDCSAVAFKSHGQESNLGMSNNQAASLPSLVKCDSVLLCKRQPSTPLRFIMR